MNRIEEILKAARILEEAVFSNSNEDRAREAEASLKMLSWRRDFPAGSLLGARCRGLLHDLNGRLEDAAKFYEIELQLMAEMRADIEENNYSNNQKQKLLDNCRDEDFARKKARLAQIHLDKDAH